MTYQSTISQPRITGRNAVLLTSLFLFVVFASPVQGQSPNEATPKRESDTAHSAMLEEARKKIELITRQLESHNKEYERKYGTIEALRTEAAAGDAKAMGVLGLRLHQGKDVAKDDVQAVRWLRQASDLGFIPATRNLAICYRSGIGVAVDPVKARDLFVIAVDAGDAEAMVKLGAMFLKGEGGPKDRIETFLLMRRAANLGHETALSELAWCYKNGIGVKANDTQARLWFGKAARIDEPNPNSVFTLGKMCLKGVGGEKDPTEARTRFKQAADAGYSPAMVALAELHMDQKRFSHAQTLLIEAAAMQDANACILLGEMYIEGTGIEKDLAVGLQWYHKAAETGAPWAMVLYSMKRFMAIEYGEDSEALLMLRKAATSGNANAIHFLGLMTEHGRAGVQRDYDEAVRLYRKAVYQGSTRAKKELARLGL